MVIKSFDEYFKENGNRAYSRTFEKEVSISEKDLENAKIVFEELRTPKEINLWHYYHYQGSAMEQKNVHDFDDKHLKGFFFGENLSRIRDAAFEYAFYYEKEKSKQEKQEGFSEIKDQYNTIRNAEGLLQKRTEITMSNTAYINYDMISRDQKDTNERITHIKERIEEKYEKVNPELAALRKQEKDGTITQKERRAKVKDYYHKKKIRENR